MKKLIASACMLALLGGATALNAQTLRVATNPTFPPFEFANSQTHEITGFEIELIRAMAKEAGHDVELVKMGFDAILPAVLTGTVDVGASGFSVTEKRKKRVAFLTPFYKSGLSILINKKSENAIHSIEDLKGKKIAVQIGTVSASVAKDVPDAKVTHFNQIGQAILDLTIGGADAVINDKPVTDYILAQQPQLAEETVTLPDLLSADDMAMIVSKRNPELLKELNQALETLKANGTYDELHQKWFGKAAQ